MKKIVSLSILLATVAIISAQEIEQVPRRDAVRIAAYLNFDLSLFNTTPIPTDADVKRPVGMRVGEYAGLIVPECKLSPDTFKNIEPNKVIPVGQLWLHKIALMKNDELISTDKMQPVPFEYRDTQTQVNLCLLGARKNQDGKLELLIFGKDKNPLLTLPIKETETTQENPIEIAAQLVDSYAKITLKLVGKYQATFNATNAE
ncbi:MAG: hypothetical protein ACPMAG_15420 [Limisphaerales bacterium]|jgi:hypothetical protein